MFPFPSSLAVGHFRSVINLEQWKDGALYDRLGLEELYTTILDVQVPSLTVPVKPGRNLAVIVEVAAMNNRHKKMGYNAALEFTKQMRLWLAYEHQGSTCLYLLSTPVDLTLFLKCGS